MCELKAYLEEDGVRREVASDIVEVKQGRGELLLKDVLGNQTRVRDVYIDEVNITAETILLRSSVKDR